MKHLSQLSIKTRVLILFFTTIFLTGATLIGIWINIQFQVGQKIYPNTVIDGIEMGYMTKDEAVKQLERRDSYLSEAVIEILKENVIEATLSGTQLKIERDITTKVDQALLIGRSPHIPSRIFQQLNGVFGVMKYTFETKLRYDKTAINEYIAVAEQTYNYPAQNALFHFENGRVTQFKAHANGNKILSDKLREDIDTEIQKITENNTKIKVVQMSKVIDPDITIAQANDLGISELIGEGVSDYSHSIETRIHNVLLAASKFNGVIVPKDAIFSFNNVIGDISASTGYQAAYVIKDGKTVLGDGGGVCQVSTTLFRAALDTGLPIIDRTAHAYRVSYYENGSEPGFDATIYSPSVDFKFKNNTPGAILIETEADTANNILVFKMYGTPDGRDVQISPVTIWDVAPPPEPTYEDDPTLPNGQVKQIDYAAWGAKTKFDYKVIKIDGTISIDETFFSNYRPWRAVFLRGTKT